MAETFTVTKLADTADGSCDTDCSLREAIHAANVNDNGPGTVDEIDFSSNLTGTMTLSGSEISISDEVVISGPGPGQFAIDANSQSRVFNANDATSLTTISGLTLLNGSAAQGGGAIFSHGSLILTDLTIRNSSAFQGGGFYVDEGDATVSRSAIIENSASSNGGGFVMNGNGREVQLVESTVKGNDSAAFGGGFYLNTAAATLNRSTISVNTAAEGGGGFSAITGDVTVNQSTISGNTTDGIGGGFMTVQTDIEMNHSTVIENAAVQESGGFDVQDGPVTLSHSVVANNMGSTNQEFYVETSLQAAYSLVEGTSDPPVANGVDGNVAGKDPQLGPLADNGGPTETHALTASSPAFDAGNPAFTTPPNDDQRGSGFPRIAFDQVDIGAVEFQGFPVYLSVQPDPARLPESTGSAEFLACLDSGVTAGEDVTVVLNVSGSATPGTDHDLSDGSTVTIVTSSNCGSVTLGVIDDAEAEADETVLVSISQVSSASGHYVEAGSNQQVDATIIDDDRDLIFRDRFASK